MSERTSDGESTQTNRRESANSDEKSGETRRRRFLKSAGTIGAFLGINPYIVKGDDRHVTIETIEVYDGENKTRRVPRSWYRTVERARRALAELDAELGDESFVNDVIRRSSETTRGLGTPKIVVEVADLARDRTKVPDTVNGIEVSVEKAQREVSDSHTGGFCDSSPSSFEGGALITALRKDSNTTDDYTLMSATCEVEDNGEKVMMTTAHGFLDGGCSYGGTYSIDIGSQDAWFGNSSSSADYIGEVKNWDWEQDWATVHIDSQGVDTMYDGILGSHGYGVNGYRTQDGVDSLIDSGETIYNYGAKTCETSGSATGYKLSACGETAVECTTNAGGGDSGSPHHDPESTAYGSYTYLVSHHRSHKVDSNGDHTYSYGIASFKVANAHNITFAT